MKPIFLIGLPGCGKTTLGVGLAAKMGLGFCDMDKWIEQRAGMTIPELFKIGESTFRDFETRALEVLWDFKGVVACGGGIILREKNREMLRNNGLVVFIDRPVEKIVTDVKTEGRPLLSQGPEQVRQLNQQRRELYLETCHKKVLNMGSLAQVEEDLIRVIQAAQQAGEI